MPAVGDPSARLAGRDPGLACLDAGLHLALVDHRHTAASGGVVEGDGPARGQPVSARDLASQKVRADLGISYDADVFRLVDAFRSHGLEVGSVVITRMTDDNRPARALTRKLERLSVFPSSQDFIMVNIRSKVAQTTLHPSKSSQRSPTF